MAGTVVRAGAGAVDGERGLPEDAWRTRDGYVCRRGQR